MQVSLEQQKIIIITGLSGSGKSTAIKALEDAGFFCVDNLPSAVPRDSSLKLSSMIIPHVLKVANKEELSSGMMTKNGVFEYAKKTGMLEVFEQELMAMEESF